MAPENYWSTSNTLWYLERYIWAALGFQTMVGRVNFFRFTNGFILALQLMSTLLNTFDFCRADAVLFSETLKESLDMRFSCRQTLPFLALRWFYVLLFKYLLLAHVTFVVVLICFLVVCERPWTWLSVRWLAVISHWGSYRLIFVYSWISVIFFVCLCGNLKVL